MTQLIYFMRSQLRILKSNESHIIQKLSEVYIFRKLDRAESSTHRYHYGPSEMVVMLLILA